MKAATNDHFNWGLLLALFLAVLFWLGFFSIIKTARAEPWEFTLKNDFFVPGGLDRYLTNAFTYKYGKYTLGNDMYSPKNKKSDVVDTGDRPWGGYSYIEREDVEPLAFGQEFIFRSRLGFVGHQSGSEELQQFIHDDLGMGQHPTWAGQNPSESTLDFLLSKRTREYVQSVLGDTQLTEEFGARLGTVNDSVFLDQEIRKHFFKYLYFYAGLRGDAVLYNTHLDGRLFQDNEYTVNKNWFVATGRAGVELYFPRWHHFFLNYGYDYVTEEFTKQSGRHSYGTITFGTKY